MASKYDFRGANSFPQNNGDFPLPSMITRDIQYANLLFNRQTVTNSGQLQWNATDCNGTIAVLSIDSPATSKCCEHRLLTNPTKIVRTNMLHACQAQGSSVVCAK
jgi:hypothetical protein